MHPDQNDIDRLLADQEEARKEWDRLHSEKFSARGIVSTVAMFEMDPEHVALTLEAIVLAGLLQEESDEPSMLTLWDALASVWVAGMAYANGERIVTDDARAMLQMYREMRGEK